MGVCRPGSPTFRRGRHSGSLIDAIPSGLLGGWEARKLRPERISSAAFFYVGLALDQVPGPVQQAKQLASDLHRYAGKHQREGCDQQGPAQRQCTGAEAEQHR